ncbi:MAG TPA: hypothetical protein VFK05_03300 [Polyangiaceae bacterium]|nr:hypothetical protein [Polyangiaceae bacterium]
MRAFRTATASQRARLLLALGAVSLSACTSSAAPEISDDSELPPVADDSCARFGFQFTLDGCSAAACAEPLCTCASTIACIPGKNERCMTGVDCGVACSAAPETLFRCAIEIAPCRIDADCGEGLCVVEPGKIDGECQSGQRGARCREDRDCKEGNCVAGDGGNRACSPGEADDLCNRATDCRSLHCTLAPSALVGTCQG